MIKSLKDAQILDGLPRVVAGQDWVIALSKALAVLHEKTLEYANNSQVYTALDTTPEEVLDALAVNWKIDWYDTDYSIEQKRRIIKTALTVRQTMGTACATRLQADAIFPGTMLEEWFEYNGTPGTFRLHVNISDSSAESPVTAHTADEIERRLACAKRWSAHLESFSFMVRHDLKIGATVERYKHDPPLCGTTYCGIIRGAPELGYSIDQELTSEPQTDAYAHTAAFAGTIRCGEQ